MALPEPECGLVISYSYLWKHESDAGQTEGVKDRPCAIVLAIESTPKHAKTVTVAPITLTPFGVNRLAAEWQAGSCQGGHMVLAKAPR